MSLAKPSWELNLHADNTRFLTFWTIFFSTSNIMATNITDDFSDLQITGEFDNRPCTGRLLRIFFCVVTYRTGAGRRLYMIIGQCPAGHRTTSDTNCGWSSVARCSWKCILRICIRVRTNNVSNHVFYWPFELCFLKSLQKLMCQGKQHTTNVCILFSLF